MPTPLRVLIIEDSEDDLKLIVLALERAGFSITYERVQTAEELREALISDPWHLVVSDYSLPELNAPTALEVLRELDPDLPFVVVSGTLEEEMASDLLQMGVSDYVLKRNLARLESIVKREMEATEQRRAHRLAEDAARQLAAIVQSSDDAIIGETLDGIIFSWNPAAERLYGWTAAEALGQHRGFAIPPDRVSELVEVMVRLRAGEQVPSLETERLRKDGKRFPVSVNVSPIFGPEGLLIGVSKLVRDLSERKCTEALLVRDALILANVWDSVVVTDLKGTVTYWNEGATRLFGWTAEEMLGRPLMERYPQPVREWLMEEIRSLAVGAEWNGEFEDFRKDGSRVWIDARVTRVHDAAGEPVGIVGVSHDITERKQAENALRESEERFRSFMEHCPAAAFIKDESGRLQYVNSAWRRQFDPEPVEWQGKTEFDFWPAETAALFQASDRQCLSQDQPLQTEECGQLPTSGETRHWLAMKFPLGDGEGRRVGGMAWDVTDRKQVEESLRAREERYRQLADAMPQIVWETAPDGYHEYYNRQWYEYTGLTHEETQGDGWNRVFHPDDQSLAWEKWRRSLETGEPYEIEYRCRRHDGQYRWFLGRALPQRDADGRILRWFGTCTDIHDFKDAEVVLRDKEAKLAEALRIARMGYWSRDLSTGLIEWSDELYQIFGVAPPAEGQTLEWLLSLIHPCDREKVGAKLEEAIAVGGYFEHTYRVLSPGGERIIHEAGRVFSGPDGRASRIAGTAQDVTERFQAQAALHLRDRAMRAVKQGIVITDPSQPDNPIVYTSPGFEQLTGYSSSESVGRSCRFLQGKDTDPAAVARIRAAIEAGNPCTVELLNYRKDGTPFWNELSLSPVRDEADRITNFVGVQADVTGRREMEQQLRQSQKIEGIGQLAGGIAHDFNNMLAVINGYSDLVLASLPAGHKLRQYVEEITNAGERAAGLTRQLLAFSRRQILEPKVLDVNQLVLGLDKMLRRLIGEDIELVTLLDPDSLFAKADAGQLEQVLLNLAINSRDAMPSGGALALTTASVYCDAATVPRDAESAPGHYVRLTVRDTGCGMEPETLIRIFEPFFTTKGVGKGTGLGLSTVYGIVRQIGGFLQVESAPGQGTTFSIYLPRVNAPAVAQEERQARALPQGEETILVVEDEPMVRALVVTMLRRCGYTVLEALLPDEALRLVDEYGGPIHMLVSDVVMPRMSGPALADAVLSRRPGIAVLFISGYTDDAVIRHGVLTQEVELLQKPFAARDLAERVRRLLDQKKSKERRGTILVVDDLADQRETLAEILSEEGYEVLTAGSGVEALAMLQQPPLPGLILFDLMMPGMNGWVFRQEQRKDPRLRDIPAVALSGQVDPSAAGEFLEVAATLRKPVDIEELLKIVRQHVR